MDEMQYYALCGHAMMTCPEELTPAQARVLGVLAGYSSLTDNGTCWPTYQTIADRARCSTKSVQRAITALVNAGQLRCKVHGGPTNSEGERPNLYVVPETYRNVYSLTARPMDLRSDSDVDKMSTEEERVNIDTDKTTDKSKTKNTNTSSEDKMSTSESEDAELSSGCSSEVVAVEGRLAKILADIEAARIAREEKAATTAG